MLSPPPPGKPRFNPPGLRFEGRYRLVIFIVVCVFIFIFFIFILIRSIVIIIIVVMMIMSPFYPLSLFGSQSGASFWHSQWDSISAEERPPWWISWWNKVAWASRWLRGWWIARLLHWMEVRCLAKLEKLYGYMTHLHMINIIYIYTYT